MNFESIKVNVVVMKGFNEDELTDFVEFVKDRPIEIRFIEFMPFD
jgi:cyclic pyranopterin phosphate synthase